jgi:hypothetical protein
MQVTPSSYRKITIKLDVPIIHDMTGCKVCAQNMLTSWKRRQKIFRRYMKARKAWQKAQEFNDTVQIYNTLRRAEKLWVYYQEALKQDEAANKKYLECGDRLVMKMIEGL